MAKPHLPTLFVGVAAGLATAYGMVRWHLRRWSEAIEKGDYDEAQRQLRLVYLWHLPLWFRRPPTEEDEESE